MCIKEGVVISATLEELYEYYIEMKFDLIYEFDSYVEICKARGAIIERGDLYGNSICK